MKSLFVKPILLVAALSVCLLLPAASMAQGVVRGEPAATEELLMTKYFGSVLSVTTVDATVLPTTHGFTVDAFTTRCAVIASGAGNSTIRVSNGTANCDCTASCTATGTTGFGDVGPKRIACTGGCSFPAGSQLTLSVNATSCATTQPNVTTITVRGRKF